jgi:small nuclear ribonucleoprotein D2
MKKYYPFVILSESIIKNYPLIIFLRNNKKLIGYIRGFDRHMNLLLENVKELWVIKNFEKKNVYHEKFFSKLILRGDSIILITKINCSENRF